MDKRTVAIVPAYNEKPRIASVLEVITSCPLIDETIVVDDGSEDNTSHAAGEFPVQVLRWPENKGKGAALQAGLEEAKGTDIFVFLDADLVNLRQEHIEALLKPFWHEDPPAMTVGVFRAGEKNSVNLAQHYFSILNGQRGLSRKYVEILPDLSWSRFGVEILLSRYAQLAGQKVLCPELSGITHVTKEEKLGYYRGFLYRLQMYRECLHSLFRHRKMIQQHPGRAPQELLEKMSGQSTG